MAYKEKDTKKWTAQWFETNVRGEKKKRNKKLSDERSMDMKLSEFVEVYFTDKQNELKDRTMKNKKYMMQQHILPYFGDQTMSEIKASQIIQWQNERVFRFLSKNDSKSIDEFIHTCIKDI